MFVIACLSLLSLAWAQIMTGGPVVQHNLNAPTLVEMANFVAKSYSASSNEQFTLGNNIELIGATTQIVSGISYHLTLRTRIHNQDHICDVTIWDQPWINHREITSDSCAKFFHQKRQAGGLQDIEMNDEVKAAAAFAADTLNARANTMKVQCLVATSGQKAQVVAGMLYEMDIVLKTSNSKKGGDVTATHGCTAPVLSQVGHYTPTRAYISSKFGRIRTRSYDPRGHKAQSCHVKVWDEPWRTPRYILKDFHCVALMS